MVLWKLFVQKASTALFNGVSPPFPKGFQTALVPHSSHPNQTSLLTLTSLPCEDGVWEHQGCHASPARLSTGVLKPQDVMNIYEINISKIISLMEARPQRRNTPRGEAVTLGKSLGIPIIQNQDVRIQMPKDCLGCWQRIVLLKLQSMGCFGNSLSQWKNEESFIKFWKSSVSSKTQRRKSYT